MRKIEWKLHDQVSGRQQVWIMSKDGLGYGETFGPSMTSTGGLYPHDKLLEKLSCNHTLKDLPPGVESLYHHLSQIFSELPRNTELSEEEALIAGRIDRVLYRYESDKA